MSAGRGAGWTAPYHGVQHFGSFSTTSFWATVQDYGTFATSLLWTPGCGFSPMEDEHATAEEARTHAETRLYELTFGRIGSPAKAKA